MGTLLQGENMCGLRWEGCGFHEVLGAACCKQTWARVLLFNSLGNLWKVI